MQRSTQRIVSLLSAAALAIGIAGVSAPAAANVPVPAPGGTYDAVGTPLGAGSKVKALGFSVDGQLYVGGATVSRVDPRSLETTALPGLQGVDHIDTVPATGTITRTYFAASSDLLQFDDQATWAPPQNPRKILSVTGQERVLAMANASTRVAIGSAGTEEASGKLSIVDVRPNLERVVFSISPFAGHDVSALQFVRDSRGRAIMLGGTTNPNGDAGLFAFQLASSQLDTHLRIKLQPWPGVAAVHQILELPDGRVWALLSDSSIYQLTLGDTLAAELSATKVLDIFPTPQTGNSTGALAVADENTVVGVAAGRVFTIDLHTSGISQIAEADLVAPSPTQDGMFFFARGDQLFRYVPGAPSGDTALAELAVDGNKIALQEGVTSYTVDTPPTNAIPQVRAVPRDYRARVAITQASDPAGSATVVVTAASGAQSTYTVRFVPMPAAGDAGCCIVPPATLEVENLGPTRRELRLNTISVGELRGRPVMYVQGGAPRDAVVLGIVDARTGELLHETRMPELTQSLSPVTGPDGKVYIPGFPGDYQGTNLIRFDPETLTTESLGQAIESETHITRMQVVGNEIWMGTFPNAHIVSFDTTTGRYTVHGRIAEDEWYARSIAHDGDHTIYAGTEGNTRIIRWNLRTGEKTDLPMPATMSTSDFRITLMAWRGGLLFAYFTASMDWHVYDPALGEWIAVLRKNAPSMLTEVHKDTGRVYLANNTANRLFYFDFETREFAEEGWSQALTYYTGGGGIELLDLKHPDWPGETLVGMGRRGGIWRYNPTTKIGEFDANAELPQTTTSIWSLHNGPDGKIYTGYSFNQGALNRFNPASGEFEVQTPFAGNQIHRMFTASDGTMWMGGYTDAQLIRYKPSQAYHWGTNPVTVESFGDDMQDRLFGFAETASGKIVVGGWGKRGHHDGILAVHDPANGQTQRYTNVLPGHQKIALLRLGDYVLVGTSVATPGATPIEPEAKIFAFNPENGSVLWESAPIPGLQTIRSLVARSDGKVWASTGTNLTFLFDPETKQVVQQIPMGAYDLEKGVDGYLYGSTFGGVMWRMHPDSGDYKVFSERGKYLVQGSDGSLYWTDDTQLFRARLVHQKESEAPTLRLNTSPTDLSRWSTGPVTIEPVVTHASEHCVLQSRDGGVTWFATGSSVNISFEGTTTIQFKAVDVWGNESAVQEVTARIDTVAPTVEASFVGANRVQVTIEAQDETSGLQQITYRLGDGAWQTYTGPFWVKRHPHLKMEYKAVDVAGNTSEIHTLSLRPGPPQGRGKPVVRPGG